MWFAAKQIVDERRAICKGCQFFNKGWCGKAFIPETHKIKKKTYHTCGCNIYLKTQFSNQYCPNQFWKSTGKLTQQEREEIKKLIGEIKNDELTKEQYNLLYDYADKIAGGTHRRTSCEPCLKDLVSKLKASVLDA